MPTPPRNLADVGLAPLSPPGAGQGIDHLRAQVFTLLSDDAKATVFGPGVDMITRGQRSGESEYVLRRMRMMLAVMARGMYEYELKRSDSPHGIDVDTTGW